MEIFRSFWEVLDAHFLIKLFPIKKPCLCLESVQLTADVASTTRETSCFLPSSLGYDYFYVRNNFLVFCCFEIVFCYQTLWRITETWRRIFQILALFFMKNTALFSVVHIAFTYWWISVFKFPFEERGVSFRIQVWVMHLL